MHAAQARPPVIKSSYLYLGKAQTKQWYMLVSSPDVWEQDYGTCMFLTALRTQINFYSLARYTFVA